MNRIFLSQTVSITRSHLLWPLACLLLVAGCSGSQLGDTLGQRLEPDPQLLENADQNTDEEVGSNTDEKTTPPNPTDPKTAPAAQNGSQTPTNSNDSQKPAAASKPAEPAQPAEPKVTGGDYTDLAKAPEEIQTYLVDLLELELLEIRPGAKPPAKPAPSTPSSSDSSADDSSENATASAAQPTPPVTAAKADEFRPNQAVTRREYARWLLATNNRFYSGQSNRKVRPGVNSSQPVFQDVPVSDPDFAAIQGLSEAGIIPSPLTGSSTTITFRPDAPLTRKDLLLWKVPLDTRQPLPQATAAAVQEAWGFQDAGKVEPRALQAVLADHQNGDFANIRRAYSYTTLFQPNKAATRAEAAAVLWRFGNSTEGITAGELRAPQADTEADSSD
ncbi:MAG: S-layer protein [Cyanobacteria bacterium J06634_5]